MRTNLQTFPKFVADPTTNEQEAIKWKHDFEKELRDMIQSMEPLTPEHLLLQEILGEILGDEV